MKVLLRADASTQIGSGHVMRCLALAFALRHHGAEVTFLSRKHEGNLFDLVHSHGFPTLGLPLGTATRGSLQHSLWLGASPEEEATQVQLALASLPSFDWILVDHYGLAATEEKTLRRFARGLAVIDDLADRAHDCDLLVDTNLQLGPARYAAHVPAGCALLLGPRFALLRPEFRALRLSQQRPAHQGWRTPSRVLVNLGGSDPSNVTGKVLQALQGVGLGGKQVDVVVGQSHPKLDEIRAACAAEAQMRLHVQAKNMAELMQQAELMIGAPGITTWERCCLGLPALLIAIADNQRDVGKGVAAARCAWYLGHHGEVAVQTIARAIERLMARPTLLGRMSSRGQALVDGLGATRVCEALNNVRGLS